MSSEDRDEAIERGKSKADQAAASKKNKGNKDTKGKKGKKGKGASANGASVAGHPRAGQAVRRAKGAGGIAGFALAALLSHHAGLAPERVVERALIAGVAGYLLAWACAVAVWRHVVLGEVRAAVQAQRAQEAGRARPMIGRAPTEAPTEVAEPEAPSAPSGEPAPQPAG